MTHGKETSKKGFTLDEAREVLRKSHRSVLSDSAFGDTEMDWRTARTGGEAVAIGYFGTSRAWVTILATETREVAEFVGEEARLLSQECLSTDWYSNNESY